MNTLAGAGQWSKLKNFGGTFMHTNHRCESEWACQLGYHGGSVIGTATALFTNGEPKPFTLAANAPATTEALRAVCKGMTALYPAHFENMWALEDKYTRAIKVTMGIRYRLAGDPRLLSFVTQGSDDGAGVFDLDVVFGDMDQFVDYHQVRYNRASGV